MHPGARALFCARDPIRGVVTHTNSAHLVFVDIGEDGKLVEVPRLILETDQDREHLNGASGSAKNALDSGTFRSVCSRTQKSALPSFARFCRILAEGVSP